MLITRVTAWTATVCWTRLRGRRCACVGGATLYQTPLPSLVAAIICVATLTSALVRTLTRVIRPVLTQKAAIPAAVWRATGSVVMAGSVKVCVFSLLKLRVHSILCNFTGKFTLLKLPSLNGVTQSLNLEVITSYKRFRILLGWPKQIFAGWASQAILSWCECSFRFRLRVHSHSTGLVF